MTNSFAGDPEFTAHFFERHGRFSPNSKARIDDFALSFVQNLHQIIELTVHVFVRKSVKWIHSALIANDFGVTGAFFVPYRGIERGRALGRGEDRG